MNLPGFENPTYKILEGVNSVTNFQNAFNHAFLSYAIILVIEG